MLSPPLVLLPAHHTLPMASQYHCAILTASLCCHDGCVSSQYCHDHHISSQCHHTSQALLTFSLASEVSVRFSPKNPYLVPLNSVLLNPKHVWPRKTSSGHIVTISTCQKTNWYRCDSKCDTMLSWRKYQIRAFFGTKTLILPHRPPFLPISRLQPRLLWLFDFWYKFRCLRSSCARVNGAPVT